MVQFKKKLVDKSDKQVSLTLVIKLFTLSTTKRSCEEKIKTLQKYSLNKKWRSGKSFYNYHNYNNNFFFLSCVGRIYFYYNSEYKSKLKQKLKNTKQKTI